MARCAAHALPVPSNSTGAYCDARQRLPMALVAALTDEVARVAMRTGVLDERASPTLLVDGTGFSMPDTQANQGRYPQSSSQVEGCGFPEARLVAMVCATTGAVVDSVVSAAKGKGTGETTALRALSERAAPGTIIVGDSIYENFPTWGALAEADCFGIFELNASRALERGAPKRLTIKRPHRSKGMTIEAHRALPKRIKLRVVVSVHPTCRDKYLVTSMLDEARYPDETILDEYAKRWDVEVDFRSFKDTLGAGILGCKTPDMVDKELAVHVLGYNLIRLLMCEAAVATGLEPRQISFRHAQQIWTSWVTARAPLDAASWQLLLDRIAQRRVRNRPGRKEPRAVKRREKTRHKLDAPRDVARMFCRAYERKGH